MKSFKGFASIPVLANNTDGAVALFGELSQQSNTYSRHRTNYANPGLAPAIELVGFSAKNDDDTLFVLATAVSNHILQVCQWVYTQHVASAIPSNASKAAFITALTTQFPDMTGVEINEILNGSPSTQRMPDYIAWTYVDDTVSHSIKVWFANSHFATQYDEYEIVMIPPVENIDNLNANSAAVSALLVQKRNTVINDVATASGIYPPTSVQDFPVVWYDPTLGGATISTKWVAVIYGVYGTDADNIKSAIRAYIAEHSVLTVWSTLYPGLYAENEFVVIPFWTDLAVPEDGMEADLYSPSIRVGKMMSVAARLLPSDYAHSVNITSYLTANLMANSAFWRSIAFMCVGNPNNVDNIYGFKQVYEDYMNIPTDSPDWSRLSTDTQDFIVKLNDALEKALEMTSISSLPVGYGRTIHNARVYLTFNMAGFTWLILTKGSYSES